MKVKDLFPPVSPENADVILFIMGSTIKTDMNMLAMFLNNEAANANVTRIEAAYDILKIWAETDHEGLHLEQEGEG